MHLNVIPGAGLKRNLLIYIDGEGDNFGLLYVVVPFVYPADVYGISVAVFGHQRRGYRD